VRFAPWAAYDASPLHRYYNDPVAHDSCGGDPVFIVSFPRLFLTEFCAVPGRNGVGNVREKILNIWSADCKQLRRMELVNQPDAFSVSEIIKMKPLYLYILGMFTAYFLYTSTVWTSDPSIDDRVMWSAIFSLFAVALPAHAMWPPTNAQLSSKLPKLFSHTFSLLVLGFFAASVSILSCYCIPVITNSVLGWSSQWINGFFGLLIITYFPPIAFYFIIDNSRKKQKPAEEK